MRILNKYIIKRYLVTFLFTLLILIPIAVAIDIAEKIDKFLKSDTLTFFEVVNDYYLNFIIYYTNTFMPLALFIAVIVFTSKLSNNSEIIAITNARISFTRFLYPYFVGATLVTIFSLLMNHYVVPTSSEIRKKFENKYIHTVKYGDNIVKDFSLQLSDNNYMYIQHYDFISKRGFKFSSEQYDGNRLIYKLTAETINWKDKEKKFRLTNYRIRRIYKDRDSIFNGVGLDTVFPFTPKDFLYKSALAQEMPSGELKQFIDTSKKRGVKNLNAYLVEFHKRTSLPISSYILTVIAVALAFKKRRGGTGVNLAIGFGLMFVYIFFLKVSEVLGGVAGANSLFAVWMPNVVFGSLAVYLYFDAKK